jgi:hypothetical protein
MILRALVVFAYVFAACMTRFTMRKNRAPWAWLAAGLWPLLLIVVVFFVATEMMQFWWTGEDPDPEDGDDG